MNTNQLAALLAFVCFSCCSVFPLPAQAPAILPGGVVNAASFAAAGQPGHPVAPGSLVSIFGTNLAEVEANADAFPLPTSLGGSSVTVDGTAAFLVYASPGQVTALVPSGILGVDPLSSRRVPFTVETSGGTSNPELVEIVPQSLGIFSLEASGCNQGAVLNVAPDGSSSVNGAANSISRGAPISIFATGLGAVASPQPDGEPAPLDRLLRTTLARPRLFLGDPGSLNTEGEHSSPALFAGRAPRFSGVDQINARVPPDAPEGCAVPLRLLAAGSSQNVTISIRDGGGACSDPAPASSAVLQWSQTTTSAMDPVPDLDRLTIDFSSGVHKRLPAPRSVSAGRCGLELRVEIAGATCPVAGQRNLDAGAVTASGPEFEVQATRTAQGSYEITLPAEAVQQGSFRITAAGGDDVGELATELRIPEPIELTSDGYPPGSVLPSDERLIITWNGGDSNSVVRARLISRSPALEDVMWECAVLASQGELSLPPRGVGIDFRLSQDAEVVIIHEPLQPELFAAPGLSLGGHHDWRYEFRFRDLRIQ